MSDLIRDRLIIYISIHRVHWLAYLGLAVLALAGCAIGKRDHYDVPVVTLPAQYKNTPVAVPPLGDSSLSSESSDAAQSHDAAQLTDSKISPAKLEALLDPVLTEWWHAFGSSELDDLIKRGLVNNPDVRIATFRVDQAKARSAQADAGKGPTVSASVGVSNQYPYYGVEGPVTAGPPYTGPNGETHKHLIQPSVGVNWRMDLWGELDSLAQSANLQVSRASFERDNAQGNAAANIASSYVEFLSLNDRIQVAHETEAVLSGMMAAVEERMKSGDSTAIDLEQQRSAVYAVRATIPSLEQQREDALGTLAFLLGTTPESLKISDKGLDSLSLPSVIPGVPSALLLRRPDVRMVEARLLAADADIDVARARILPPLDLTTQSGYGSYYLSNLFTPQSLFWNAMANLSATIFDGGKLVKEKAYAQAVHEEMVETYARAIYQGVREVESALNAIRQTGNRLDAQKKSADSARHVWDFSAEVYGAGAIDYMTLLESERTYHQKLDEYYHIRMDRYRALVNLFHALGGGVPQGKTLPGKGVRPSLPPGGKDGVLLTVQNNALAVDIDWVDNPMYEKENVWLVELPSAYPRNSIDSVWLDLRTRFPLLMESHSLWHRKKETIENSADENNKQSLYHLYIAKFQTAASAEELCTLLQSGNQHCRVVMSQMGNIVELEPRSLRMDTNLAQFSLSGQVEGPSHTKIISVEPRQTNVPAATTGVAGPVREDRLHIEKPHAELAPIAPPRVEAPAADFSFDEVPHAGIPHVALGK